MSPARKPSASADRRDARREASDGTGEPTHALEEDARRASGALPSFELWSGAPAATLGPYRLLRPLGRGGMGVVFLAEQCEPVRRRVAIKVIGSLSLDRAARHRFAAEQQALARFNHPHVARLYESGATPEGWPYFVMELVERGEPITGYCDSRRLDLDARLALFAAVCEGVRHAHQKGVLHRDLKPGNVLVTEIDGRPVPKVIDFGVAEALDRPLVTAALTREAIVGTPLYLAPECLEAGGDADSRSDVYALGVLLYELLAGIHPFGAAAASLPQLLTRIVDPDRPRPSACFAALATADRDRVAAARGTTSAALVRRLRGELDWIASKAVRAEREERYGGVADLVAELDRLRRNEPVVAGPPAAVYRARKWIRRHRAAFAAGLALVASLAAGVVARGREARRANESAAAAHQSMLEAKQTLDLLVDLFANADPERARGETLTARELLARGAERLDGRALRDAPLVRARLLATIAEVELGLGLYREALPRARTSLRLRQSVLSPPDEELAGALRLVGRLETDLGELDSAERSLRAALAQSLELAGERSAPVAGALNLLGSVAFRRARLDEAAGYFERALAIYREGGPESARSTVLALGNLATTRSRQGRIEESIALQREALRLAERSEGPDGPAVAGRLVNLASTLLTRGRASEAVPLLERALSIREPLLGPHHPHVARILVNLAKAKGATGELDAARTLAERALAIRTAALGADHVDVALCHSELAEIAERRGDLGEAERRHRRALSIWETKLGARHPFTGFPRASLGLLARRRGDLAAAERELRRAVDLLAAADALDLAWAQWGLGCVLRDRGATAEAEGLLRAALAVRERELAAGDADVARAREDLAELLRRGGRHSEARELLSPPRPLS